MLAVRVLAMRYKIYSDESSTGGERYMLIGGLWVPWDDELAIRASLMAVRAKHQLRAEMKWTKVTDKMLRAYMDFVDVFFEQCSMRFKCIVLDTRILDYRTYNSGDKELGFYKFYYQLISRNLSPRCEYWLYTDERQNRKPYRLEALKLAVNNWWTSKKQVRPLRHIEPCKSHNDDIMQLADILLGAIASAWNERKGRESKKLLKEHIAQHLSRPSLAIATAPNAPKVNIWKWQPA